MKTKKFYTILLCIVMMFIIHCGKGKSTEKETVNEDQTVNQSQSTGVDGGVSISELPKEPGDQNVVLQIESYKYTNLDFRKYLQVHYPDLVPSAKEFSGTQIIPRLFDSYVQQKIVLYSAQREDVPVSDEETEKYLKQLNSPKFDKKAASDAIMVEKYLNFKIYNQVNVTDSEIQDYYRKNLDSFKKMPEVELYQILVKDRDTAQRIRGTLINSPEKFEEIAKEQSTSQEKDKGGYMGFFEKGTLPKDMEDVVFALNMNSISPVIQSTYGFHIFKVNSKKKERILSLDRVKPEIKNILLSERLSTAKQELFKQLRKSLNVTIYYDKLFFKYKNNTFEGDMGDENNEQTHSASDPGMDNTRIP